MKLKNLTPKVTNTPDQKVFNIDNAIFIQNGGNHFNNGGFFTAFSQAFKELAQNKDLKISDIRLLFLIMSYMGEKEMMITPNRQRLLTMDVYAKEMGFSKSTRSHVNNSFNKLEQMGYFKRDKGNKSLELMINPAMAYSGKTREYTMVWNQTAIEFGNTPRKLREKNEEDGEQEWDSHLIEDIKKKRTMKQLNLDGGIDDVEII